MITEERLVAPADGELRARTEKPELAVTPALVEHESRPRPNAEVDVRRLLRQIVVAAIGAGIALTGWLLILTVFFSFIGLPVFVLGLAVMQSQER
jgi:hypothetical protein